MSPTLPVVLILMAVLLGACAEQRPSPNVLLITVDTLRADFLGAYGFPVETSPHLDALARRAAVFDRGIAASSRTAPSHATMMTSRFVPDHSIAWMNGASRLEGLPTLAQTFADHSYATAAFVGNAILTRRIGLDAGFDVYDDELPDVEPNRPRAFERRAQNTTERALAWVRQQADTGKPYFLWIHYQDPHGPYTPPAPYDEDVDLPGISDDPELEVLPRQRGKRGIPAYQALPGLRRPSQYLSRYVGEIRYFDAWLGRLLQTVELAKRPLAILLTSDHGESVGEEGYYFSHGHATTPDLARVPFLVAGPGIESKRWSQAVHHVDVMPTLLELAGLPVPEGTGGIALGPLLRGEVELGGHDVERRVLFTDIGSEVSAYRGDRFSRVRLEDRAIPGEGIWRSYRWDLDGSWVPVDEDPAIESSLSAYLQKKAHIVKSHGIDARAAARLRALGYLEPDGQ